MYRYYCYCCCYYYHHYHWKVFIIDTPLSPCRQLAQTGVNTLRVPIGDWMFKPYEPFIECWDGAVEVIKDRHLQTFEFVVLLHILCLHVIIYSNYRY